MADASVKWGKLAPIQRKNELDSLLGNRAFLAAIDKLSDSEIAGSLDGASVEAREEARQRYRAIRGLVSYLESEKTKADRDVVTLQPAPPPASG